MPTFAWINPLKCPESDFAAPGSAAPAADRLLDYLCAPQEDRSPEAFVIRYREGVPDGLFSAPAESNLLDKLVWPLQIAADARKAFEYAVSAVLIVLGQTVTSGSMVLRGDLMAYLTERGLLSPASESRGA